ncbi:wax ester/triacylglycerol synthase domain-containing protein [Nocardia sp. CA-135398]|uniref:wax ester/triacylglycerol synthase domain-containing protein n=1 Tax=Nocardia sp. CA-135398 TaxID=3239977 RepID=UPI003D99E176
MPEPAPIERATATDLTVLVADRTSVPMNIGAILVFGDATAPNPAAIRALLADRVTRIPRLRQTLRRAPFGCGRPIWVDAPDFQVDRQLEEVRRPDSGGDRALFDIAAELLCTPLPDDGPRWRAHLVTVPGCVGLVVIMHHVLADGVSGLAVLSALADESPALPSRDFPRPPPRRLALAADATREKIRAFRSLPADIRRGFVGLRELGFGWESMRPIERTSLNRPTSRRRRLAWVTVPLDDVVTTAHRHGGTVNDVVLAAVTGALLHVLHTRGEWPDRLVVSVPVSGRRGTAANELGNDTGVRPISVPATGDDSTRLTEIITATKASSRTSRRASSAAPLGALFRMLHRTGLFRLFIEHQRMVHTFETNLRGPTVALHLAGSRVETMVPLVATPGNTGVTFAVLSYAGTLGVAVIADPVIVPDQDALAESLSTAFGRLAR